MTNILDIKITNKYIIKSIFRIIKMSSDFFSVKYLTDILDKCSLKLFGYKTNKFIEMHFSDIF